MSTAPTRIAIDGHTDLARADGAMSFPLDDAITGGLSAAVVAVRASKLPGYVGAEAGVLEQQSVYEAILRTALESNGRARIARSAQEVRENAAAGVFSCILGLQNARPLDSLADLERWIDRGVAVVDFGFIGDNQWAKSARPYPHSSTPGDFAGLSELGRRGVELLNARGVVVDIAQVSKDARREIVERSQAPVIASHNGLRALVGDADRTISDDEVRAVAASGGVVNIVAFDGYLTARGSHPQVVADMRELRERFGLPAYRSNADYYAILDPETREWDEQKFDEYSAEYHRRVRHDWPRSDVRRLVEAVRYVADLVGVDHVGVATDFHHGGGITGWMDYTGTPNLTAALEAEFSSAEVDQIWGGNFLRVWERAAEAAQR